MSTIFSSGGLLLLSSGLAEIGPPPNLTATVVSDTRIDLSWGVVTAASGYDIERDGTVIAMNHQTTSYSDTDLTAATQYSYRVRSLEQVAV